MMSELKHYTDFLKEPDFVQWQLTSDEALESYWLEFIQKNPHLENEFSQAITSLKKEILNKNTLSKTEQSELLYKIEQTLQASKKQKQRKIIVQYVAASVAVALLLIGITFFLPKGNNINEISNESLIVGELLNNEDIKFITNEKSMSFQNDVEVKLDKRGTVEITQKDKEAINIEVDNAKINTLIVPYGKRSTITLADGTKVWLNSGSLLEFPSQFANNKREIKLKSGEIYLEVSPDKNKPFNVITSDLNVRVYGTKFNISNYNDAPHTVVLIEGSVSIQTNESKEVILNPNELVKLSENGSFEKTKVDGNEYISWKDGYLTLNKTPMSEILNQISRYYNLSFDFEKDVNLKNKTCTGKIYLSENLDNVMTTLTLLSSTQYKRDKNSIYIINEP